MSMSRTVGFIVAEIAIGMKSTPANWVWQFPIVLYIVNNSWMSIGVSCQQTSSGVAEGKAAFPNNSNNTGIAWSSVVVHGEIVNKQNLNSIAATCTIRDLHAFASSQLSINRLKLIIWFTRKKSESIGLWLNHQFDCRKIEKFLLS